MKKLFTLLLLFICIETIAQTTPPPIRKKPLTNEEKIKNEQDAMYKRQGFFRPNTVFEKNKRYYSEDNRYCMVFQEDGNLAVYKMMTQNSYKAIWNTHTNGKAIKKCVFQDDGNLVLYDYTNKAIWDAFTDQYNKDNAGIKKYIPQQDYFVPAEAKVLVMQSDGNLVIYGAGAKQSSGASWASGSFEKN